MASKKNAPDALIGKRVLIKQDLVDELAGGTHVWAGQTGMVIGRNEKTGSYQVRVHGAERVVGMNEFSVVTAPPPPLTHPVWPHEAMEAAQRAAPAARQLTLGTSVPSSDRCPACNADADWHPDPSGPNGETWMICEACHFARDHEGKVADEGSAGEVRKS
jgi:hypothetical protein